MNCWTRRTLGLVESGYLDQLTTIYRARTDQPKRLPPSLKEALQKLYSKFEEAPEEYAEELLELLYRIREVHDRFAFNHPYVPMLRSREVRSKNPNVRDILIDEIKQRGLGSLIAHLEAPPELNRQMGTMFKDWVKQELPLQVLRLADARNVPLSVSVASVRKRKKKLEINPLFTKGVNARPKQEERKNSLLIFVGGDEALADMARQSFHTSNVPTVKGIDFFAVVNGWKLLGEAKFQSDVGGNQDNQRFVGKSILSFGINEGQKVAGLFFFDGMPVLRRYRGLELKDEHIVMSALLLPELLVEVAEQGGSALTQSC